MLETFLFKSLAMCSIITVSTPLQVLKMRLQTNTQLLSLGRISEQYRSFKNCLSTILKKQGWVGLWKGNTVSMARVTPLQAINYYTRKSLQQHFTNNLSNNILISIVSGISASTILYPSDVLRQFLNNNTSSRLTFLAATRSIIAQYGYKYFYKGYPNILMTTIVYRSCYNGLYDTNKVNAKTLRSRALVAYLSTIVAEYLVYPIEIIRRRRIIMNAKEGFLMYGRNVWKKEGIAGFYKAATIVPIQSLAWSLVLIVFDTAGIGLQISFQG